MSCTSFSSLPVDVMVVEVLSRLPVKSLLRLRCVCKEWRNLISSSSPGSVKQLHDQRSQRNHYLLVWNRIYIDEHFLNMMNGETNEDDDDDDFGAGDRIRLSVIDMIDERVQDTFEVYMKYLLRVLCCRDLICFAGLESVHACNPSTQELVKLPDSPNTRFCNWVGFGYLPSTQQYKFVRWFYPCGFDEDYMGDDYCNANHDMWCEIFSGRADSDSWRIIGHQSALPLKPMAVCVNGVLYWLLNRLYQISENNFMLSFDLEKEETKLFPHPELSESDGYKDYFEYLLELKGLLSLVYHQQWPGESEINIWVLKDELMNPNWVLEYNVILPCDSIALAACIPADNQEAEEEFVFLSEEGVLYCNIENGSIRRPENLVHMTMNEFEWPCHYFDSFFSLASI